LLSFLEYDLERTWQEAITFSQFTVYNMDGFAYQVSFYTDCQGGALNTYVLYLEDPSLNLV